MLNSGITLDSLQCSKDIAFHCVAMPAVCCSFEIRRQRIGYEKGIFKTAWKIHRCKSLQFSTSCSCL